MIRLGIAIALIALVTFTSHIWTAAVLEHPAALAFVLSDHFWPALFGAVVVIAIFAAAAFSAAAFHPDALSGRLPEGDA